MKKTFQIFKDVAIARGGDETSTNSEKTSLTYQLKQDYAKCTGFFMTRANASVDLDQITMNLKIASNEILPSDTDASLFLFSENKSLAETIYDFSREDIPAKSSEVEISFDNPTSSVQTVNLYFVLEN